MRALRDIDRAASESLNRPRPSSPDETHTTYGTFVDAAGMFFSDRLVLNAGVRRDIIDLKLEATAGSPQCAPTGRDERIFCPRPDS